MTKGLKFAAALVAAIAIATPAMAQQAPNGSYNFSFYDALNSGSGSLTVTGGSGLVTGISGSVNDGGTLANITGLSGYAGADNTLYTNAPFFDFAGLSFSLDDGNIYNLFYSDGTYIALGQYDTNQKINSGGNVGGAVNPATINVSAVPEPATWGLMLLGFGAIGYSMRRRGKMELALRRAA